jgi:hypothetical protein
MDRVFSHDEHRISRAPQSDQSNVTVMLTGNRVLATEIMASDLRLASIPAKLITRMKHCTTLEVSGIRLENGGDLPGCGGLAYSPQRGKEPDGKCKGSLPSGSE